MRSRLSYAFFGVLATVVGMATGHFVAAIISHPDASPVLAVGSTVIDHTPQQLKEWAITHFGSNDKTVLVGSVLAGVVVLAAVAGLLTLRRFVYGATMLVVLVAVAGAAVLTRPTVTALDVVPAVATIAAGLAALWWLDRTFPATRTSTSTSTTTAKGDRLVLGADSNGATSGATDVERPGPSRRGVLVATAVLAATAAVLTGAGKVVNNLRARPEEIALPKPTSPAPPLPMDLSVAMPEITPLAITNDAFYRVDTRLDTPVVASDGWTLTVDGDVAHQLEISFEDLLEMDMIERDITMTCVSNSVGGKYVGSARWLGVPLKTILDMAGVGDTADQILTTDFDGMTISTPLDLATDGRDAMLAIGMNGVQLPREHGFPVRMIVPGLYGFISGTKWITKMTLTTYADQQSYWTKKKWGTDAPIKPTTRIDTPRPLSTVKAGKVVIGGVAWAQNDEGVKTVQVQIDSGPWKDVTNGPDVNNVYWRQWYYEWDATAGSHQIAARVIDGAGGTQSAVRALPFPDGASGIQSYLVTVA